MVWKPASCSLPSASARFFTSIMVDMLQRAGGGFCQHAGFLRAVPRGGDQRAGAEGDCRAHDGADIVRVGDLVEHETSFASPSASSALGLQRLGLDQHALMDGVAAGDLVDVPGLDQFGLEGQGGEVGDCQTLGGVARHQHAAILRRGLSSAARTVCRP